MRSLTNDKTIHSNIHSTKTMTPTSIRLTWQELYPVLCAAAAYGIIVYAVGVVVLQQFPNSADEFAYLYQTHTFATGKIYNSPHPNQEFLSPFFIKEHEGKVFSIFPPGWSFVLTLGVWVQNPWIINPILAASTCIILYTISRHFFDRAFSWLTIGFWMISPMVLLNNASLYSHTCCSFFILLTTLLLLRCQHNLGILNGAAVGLSMGLAFCTRELTAAAILTLPMLYVLYSVKSRILFLAFAAAGFVPIALLYGWYCSQLTGTWFYPPRYLLLDEYLGFGWREIRLFDYIERQYHGPIEAFNITFNNSKRLITYTALSFPLIAVMGFWFFSRNAWMTLFFYSSLLLILIYALYPSDGGTQYGARFYFEALPFFALSALNVIQQSYVGKRNMPAKFLVAFSGLFLLFVGISFFTILPPVYQSIYERSDLFRQIKYKKLENAIVFVASPSGDMTQGDLIRNLPGYETASVIYAWDLGARNQEIMAAFHERTFFRYEMNAQTGLNVLSPMQP